MIYKRYIEPQISTEAKNYNIFRYRYIYLFHKKDFGNLGIQPVVVTELLLTLVEAASNSLSWILLIRKP